MTKFEDQNVVDIRKRRRRMLRNQKKKVAPVRVGRWGVYVQVVVVFALLYLLMNLA